MADNGSPPDEPAVTRVALGDWSRDECLYIQLHSEVLLAVAHLPAAPFHSINDISQYVGYCQYFALPDAVTSDPQEETGSGVVKGINTFIAKRDELSGWVMWALQATKIKATFDKKFHDVKVSPAMLRKYRKIRERIGFDTYIYNPKLYPALWSFLEDAARNQFPEYQGDVTQAEHTRDVDNDGSAHSVTKSGPVNDQANTSDQDLMEEDDTSAAGDDVNSGATDEEEQSEPGGFAQGQVRARCTGTNNDGTACQRRSLDIEEKDRASWRCHLHDPEKKKITAAARAARNAAKKLAVASESKKQKGDNEAGEEEDAKAGGKRARKAAAVAGEGAGRASKKRSK
ncbi:uncharacterized protein J4E88_003563 [Alternaria novae-zelandiae]|uniref:uncharacterized protein n=1 Tax=Alternaria novae-zelandiae TaxID=430562 RepID=UPI0020C464FE|nr:uncharacterized protein J4E88_003563 [Alternaria novae-zelandiae]KAI4685728.1 hypothetical protein J4E88_003563 [Alternaria novae-zelandiae]